ncbi:MAG: amino acid--tRNA ligase-related protein, partial [Pseudomonadota bacterium]|nr:amino acid--tRNA ligase-related protein [Pseudomonadota bacterium]
GDIFQLCKVFRDAELGRWHQPEFTMLEWYRVGWDEKKLMQEAELLLKILLKNHYSLGPSKFLSYREAFDTHLAVNPLKKTTELEKKLVARGIDIPTEIDWNGLLDLALSSIVLPALDPSVITFIFDFPADQAQLARIKYDSGEKIAARFEVFFQGLEIGNGFGELTDPAEQRNRFKMALIQRKYQKRPVPPIDEKLLAALESGLPACAGVAMGIDRIVALVGKLPNVAKAISFAHPL